MLNFLAFLYGSGTSFVAVVILLAFIITHRKMIHWRIGNNDSDSLKTDSEFSADLPEKQSLKSHVKDVNEIA